MSIPEMSPYRGRTTGSVVMARQDDVLNALPKRNIKPSIYYTGNNATVSA